MKIMVTGKGGREHALARTLARSPLCSEIICVPGNPGMEAFARCIPADTVEDMVSIARKNGVDLVVPGPEADLAAGIADALNEAGIPVFGPDKGAAQVESSKDFAKTIMKKYGIPTADYQTFTDLAAAKAYVCEKGAPIVIKEDGLRAGKGVTVARTLQEALDALDAAFVQPNTVVIEECLEGFEYSLICLVHEDTVIPLEIAQDHKAAYDGDTGPNTGGMGAYSPVKTITPDIVEETVRTVMEPMAKALVQEGVPFTGFLYGGLMLTEDGPKVIEFNARFGDPEAEVILPRLESDFVQAIQAVMNKEKPALQWNPAVAHGVVLASTGYPASSTKGAEITSLDDTDALVFHMGTKREKGKLLTDGGRVLMVVTMEDTLEKAFSHTYKEVDKIQSEALFHRNDIGKKDM